MDTENTQMPADNRKRVLSLSYGKDGMACIYVITEILKMPLDRIITADVWATDTIPAELPPMVDFKTYADKTIKERWGIEVEHFYATYPDGRKKTYDSVFHTEVKNRKCTHSTDPNNLIYGFPTRRGPWCNSRLKIAAIDTANKTTKGCINYIGIAADEPERIERHRNKENLMMPLVIAGWKESDCRKWCEDNNLLSPVYQTGAMRGGCWFCHQQGIDELRRLRKNYPEYWQMMLAWDNESVIPFKQDGYTIHMYDERFALEDEGQISPDEPFYWNYLDHIQMRLPI